MRGLDKDCDSTIDLHEFASRFDPVFTRLNAKQDVRNTCGILVMPIALSFSCAQSARVVSFLCRFKLNMNGT